MFTGIVREVGRVVAAERSASGLRLTLAAPRTAPGLALGDSVAVSGCCLTAVELDRKGASFDVVPETIRRTTLGDLRAGSAVNVEPALRAGDAMGGHYVQGHVDGVAVVRTLAPEGDGARLTVDAPADLLRYCVEKGSIALDGVSLTVAALDERGVAVALVPHTLAATTLGALEPGARLNVEVDVLAKYVVRLVAPYRGATIPGDVGSRAAD